MADFADKTDFQSKVQSLMNEVYNERQKDENKGKGKWDVLDNFSEAHQAAVVFGNFNYQVENGGLHQWIYNGYFHDDSEKLTQFLETGAALDGDAKRYSTGFTSSTNMHRRPIATGTATTSTPMTRIPRAISSVT